LAEKKQKKPLLRRREKKTPKKAEITIELDVNERLKRRPVGLDIPFLLLVLALAITIVASGVKALSDAIRKNTVTTQITVATGMSGTAQSTVKTDPRYLPPVPGAWNEGYKAVSRNNSAMYEGDLLVVNYMHEYRFPSSINLVEMWGKSGHNTNFVLGNGMTYPDGKTKSVELSKHIVESITTMLADMKAANSTLTDTRRLMILSGYRTLEKQQALYDAETVEGLTAKPGHSEHHTGLTFDIRISIKGQNEIEYLNAEEQAWIVNNCAKYGFILRYTDAKKDITGILNEDWHFRYVGVELATYLKFNDLVLEEYYDALPSTNLIAVPEEYWDLLSEEDYALMIKELEEYENLHQ
jgi:hypothetical protein